MNIRFSPHAGHDLDQIRARIEADRPAVAPAIVARILQSIGYLKNFPRLGRPGILPDTRELSIYGLPYKAVYRIEGDVILVLAIIHTAREFP